MPAAPKIETSAPTATGLFSTGKFAAATGAQQAIFGQTAFPDTQQNNFAQPNGMQQSLFAQPNTAQQQAFPTGTFPTGTFGTGTFPTGTFGTNTFQQLSPTAQNTTSGLALLNAEQKSGNTIKLTGPAKVVQVPVAPGQYVTGLLPIQGEVPAPLTPAPATRISKFQKMVLIVTLIVLVVGGIGAGIFLHARSGSAPNTANNGGPGPATSTMAQATATAA